MVNMITMRFRKHPNEEEETFTIGSLKKLVKEIKRQFLLKNNLSIENIDSFPADQEIPL